MNVLDVLFHYRQADDLPVCDLAIGQPIECEMSIRVRDEELRWTA
jgi:hypothetical protein